MPTRVLCETAKRRLRTLTHRTSPKMGARLHRGDEHAWCLVLGAVWAARGNVAVAARDAGLSERSLRRWVSAYPRLRRAVEAARELHEARPALSGELFGWVPA